jgi:hypothetical protein
MNTEALFLFLILLLGLVLCSFLGGKCNREGFDLSSDLSSAENSVSNMFNSGVSALDNTYNSASGAIGNAYNAASGAISNTYNSATSAVTNGFDNYNHYSGSASSSQLQNGMTFTDASGDTVTVVINSNGSQSLQLLQAGQSTPMVLNSTPPSSSTTSVATPNTFYAPIGNITANVITGSNGQVAIQFNLPNGQNVVFTQSGSNSNSGSITSTQYYGSTGYPIQASGYSLAYQGPYGGNAGYAQGPYGGSAGYAQGPYGNTVGYVQGPNGNTVVGGYGNNSYTQGPYGGSAGYAQGPYGGSAGYAQGPYGNTVGYAQGPYGNTVVGGSSNGYGNTYYSTMPQGIPASQIPPGQEDLYILKSEIVPPVCPACPTSSACPRQEKCPPCPACARCPEPSFECKKVPNYNAIDNNSLPQPVLNDFSTFGM